MSSTQTAAKRLAGVAAIIALAALPALAQGAYSFSCLNVSPGATSAELDFAWIADAQGKAVVQLAKAADKADALFPADKAQSFSGVQSTVTATLFNGDDKSSAVGGYSDKVVVKGLSPSSSYFYRVGDGQAWSPAYFVATADPKSFGFFVVGDPQLGAKSTGPKTLDSDAAGWADTVAKASATHPQAAFMVALGDEVNDYNDLKLQQAEYKAYFAPIQLKSLPVATVDGNHDFQMGEFYGFHYNQPNLSTFGTSYGNDGDYWFTYGDVLFLLLNSNTESVATHDLFIRDAVAKNPQAAWRVVGFHHSIYSEAEHLTDPDVVDRRANYAPIFDRYKIDLVLQGHDHSYTRTYPIAGGKPLSDEVPSADGVISGAKGAIYVTFNSGSGSKFYDWKDAEPEVYSAVRWQGKVPSFGYVSVSGDTLKLEVYRTDDMSLIDSLSIQKTK